MDGHPSDHVGRTHGEFSVVQFLRDGTHEYVRRWVSGKEAVEVAKLYTENPAAKVGIIRKVIITDGGDHTNFKWEFGKGVVFPEGVR